MRALGFLLLPGCAYGASGDPSYGADARDAALEVPSVVENSAGSVSFADAAVEPRDTAVTEVSVDAAVPADMADALETADASDAADAMETGDTADGTTGKTWIVTVKTTQFIPDYLKIKPGDTIEVRFFEGTHDIVSGAFCTSDGLFGSGVHTAPYTYSFTYAKKGYFTFFDRRADRCTLYGMYVDVDVLP